MNKPDILLVTVESARYDHRDHCPVFDGLDTARGIAPAHYTRPSLAALLSGQYDAALQSEVQSPTLPSVLQDAGYDTAGFAYSPQTAKMFGFDEGMDHYEAVILEGESMSRGSKLRERLGELGLVRRLHRRLKPKSSTLAEIPRDKGVIDVAIERWEDMSGPQFMWIHLMGSHRPYGWGDEGLPDRIGRRAANAGGRLGLSTDAHESVSAHYRAGLKRTGDAAQRLLDAVSDDTRIIVCGDHGEELGEEGYYFHGPYRRRVVPTLTDVPVGASNIDLPSDPMGLLDIPALLAREASASIPDTWDATLDSNAHLTLAPWNQKVSVSLTTDSKRLVFNDAEVDRIVDSGDRGVNNQLEALGYV